MKHLLDQYELNETDMLPIFYCFLFILPQASKSSEMAISEFYLLLSVLYCSTIKLAMVENYMHVNFDHRYVYHYNLYMLSNAFSFAFYMQHFL